MLPVYLASVLCRVLIVKRGADPVNFALLPTGTCFYCCPINVNADVQYLLYTRKNPRYANILNANEPHSLQRSNFDRNTPTIIYIHGYSDSAPGRSAAIIRDVYLKRAAYNVILVNWAKLASLPWYKTAVRNTRIVGPHVARFVTWLDAVGAAPISKMHVIGFSLGAEIAGFMGKALLPRKIGRITGLDPAYPLYKNTNADGHLTATDAAFVDVIHSDGGIFGFPTPLGHVDFYPNGGRAQQPGCNFESVLRRSVSRLINQYITCGHNRAWMFYAESVLNPEGFPASRCPKWHPRIPATCAWIPETLMGIAANPTARGKFYLRTNGEPPFARDSIGYLGK